MVAALSRRVGGLAGVVCIVAGVARADDPRPQPGLTLAQATAAFDALVAARTPRGDLPRLADPEAAPVLRRIWAAAVPAGAPGGTAADVAASAEVSAAESKLLETYLYFPTPTPKDIDFDRLAAQFGPEFAHTLAAAVAAASRLSAAFDAYRSRHPDPDPAHHAAMVRLLRSPGLGLIVNGEKFMTAKARPEDVARVGAAFGAGGSAFALAYSKDERAMIAALFRRLAQKLDGGPRRDIERAADALATAPCGVSCQVPP